METRSAQEIWEAALGELQIQVSKPNYRTWLEKTEGLSYQDNQFIVSVPNTFVAEYLDRNQRSLIEKTLISLTLSPNAKVVFQVNGKFKNSSDRHGVEWNHPPTVRTGSKFNSKYAFDSFVVGSCNQLAFAAAQGVTQNPGHSYNPLFICGGVGLGKTHLLHAIGQAAHTNNHMEVTCVSAEQFTNEFINAIRERKTADFRSRYRSTGMLLVDDIHFISGKEQTEESFFHTFNELHNANHQIVLTSDQPPKSISLEERLRSRFEWGLIVDIQPPEFETRLAILKAKAEQREVNIDLDVLEFIAQKTQQNIRELEGSLNRVVAYTKLFQASPNLELATQALKDIASKKPEEASMTPSLVLKVVANSFRLAPTDLKGSRRDKETTLARRVAMYLLRQETSCTVAQVGQELGGRDASAVTNAYKKITNDIKVNAYLKRKISDIQQRLNHQPKSR